MKKSKVLITSIVGGAILLTGCTNAVTPTSVAKNLDHNLNVLQTTVNKLDTINNSYLSNPDIYPIVKDYDNKLSISTSAFVSEKFIPIKNEIKKIATQNENLSLLETEQNENYSLEKIEKNNKEQQIDESLENNKEHDVTNFYYYDVKPIGYNPRYLQDISAIENGDYLSNYISKVRTLYAITNDVIEANSTLSNCKDYLLTYVVEIKDLNEDIKNGTFEPNNQQIAALNNYIGDIKTTIKRIKRCNGELSNEVNNISKTDSNGITTGIDVIKSNYLKVLNHLDTRITYLKNALTTLEQIKLILQETQNIIENENIEPPIVETETNEENNFLKEELNNDTNNNDNKLSGDNFENSESTKNTNINESTESTEISESTENNNENVTPNNESAEENDENETTNDENINKNDENNIVETDSNENEKTTNIDTYQNTSNNLDTYNENLNKEDDCKENCYNENNENVNEETLNNNNTNVNNNFNNLNNGVNNNSNAINNINDEDKINTPNGTFQNGIITQNNLNNGVNNGVNGFGTGNGINYNNMPNTYNNGINQTNKNVDTYGYNTMIDMLNHGTVNNGINTLDIEASSKPSMVNSDGENSILESVDGSYSVQLLNNEKE